MYSILLFALLLALFVGVALYLRIALSYDQVFTASWIKNVGNDSHLFMRQVDNLVHNFPNLISLDPYRGFPRAATLGNINFFVYFIAGIAWLVGLGSPTQHTVDVVGVYLPAILSALTIIPIFFIGKTLFNRWAGVLSAGLFAILPGDLLTRTRLGFTDRDALALMLTTFIMLFLILAIRSACSGQLTFNSIRSGEWIVFKKPFLYSLLVGIFLGVYLLTWKGALILLFIIFAYIVIQFVMDYLRQRSTDYLFFIGTIVFSIALIIFWPAFSSKMHLSSLVIALLTPTYLSAISWLTIKWKIRRGYYPLILIVFGVFGLLIINIINSSLLNPVLRSFNRILTQPASLSTIGELQPLLLPSDVFSLSIAWENFTTGFFLGFIALGIIIYSYIKRDGSDKTLFIVWSLVILAFTLFWRRFSPFWGINMVLLIGYFSWLILEFFDLNATAAKLEETKNVIKKQIKEKARWQNITRFTNRRVNMVVGITIIFFLVFFPNIAPAIATAKDTRYTPSDGWTESLFWLKYNSPDPFIDSDFYYHFYETPFYYPETAYGVVSWWDYGYWVIRIGHRLPNCDPGGGNRAGVAKFFTAQNEAQGNESIVALDSKYIIADYQTATTKFHGVASYAGDITEKFYDDYYGRVQDKLVPVRLYHPEYYRSMIIRLYNFEGREVDPQRSDVISYEERVLRDGTRIKEVTGIESFHNYHEAEAYISSQKSSANHRIVSHDPFASPVPLEALDHYKLVYRSESLITEMGVSNLSEVKIFKYIDKN
jgi:dolichyl-diphosphooligosaccharide--protein glycosyltransferase